MIKIWAVCLAFLCGWGGMATTEVYYETFGAKGDGETDDFSAIVAAHDYANKHNLPVKANDNATYYIGGGSLTAVIKTNTDWGKANFIIDDLNVENRGAAVFNVVSALDKIKLQPITNLRRKQAWLSLKLPYDCLFVAVDDKTKRYIRYGIDADKGSPQTDVFIVHKNGRVNKKTPIIWDFKQLTSLQALPIDDSLLTVSGGTFTTIANRMPGEHKYFNRGISIQRSNVLVDGVKHKVVESDGQSFPYTGFININNCANVTVKNTILSGRKLYHCVKANSKSTTTGTYDISITKAVNVSFINCSQFNDILDPVYWGIMGSNYCKNLQYDGCTFSRFDAHMGVVNATIRNSTLGYQGINAIGQGTVLVENSTVNGRYFINLRSDYGSTWQGNIVIKNCVYVPSAGKAVGGTVIGGTNSGRHNFGYKCYMPEKIEIFDLTINDENHPEKYAGPAVLGNFNSGFKDASYQETYPYIKTKEIIIKDLKTASGKPWRLSDNPAMFGNIELNKL